MLIQYNRYMYSLLKNRFENAFETKYCKTKLNQSLIGISTHPCPTKTLKPLEPYYKFNFV